MNSVGLADLGFPGLFIGFMIVASWVFPLAAAVWLFMTLRRIRDTQEAMRMTLESIERLMHRAQ
jgi:hypothetical protein